MFHPDTLIKLGRQQQHEILQQVRYGGQAQDIEKLLRNESRLGSGDYDWMGTSPTRHSIYGSPVPEGHNGKRLFSVTWLRSILAVVLHYITV